MAVADGLGHGEEAAEAARTALQTIRQNPRLSIISLLERIHEELRETRGVVLSVAILNFADNTLTWAGVGNVEGVVVSNGGSQGPQQVALLRQVGVLGHRMASLRASIITVGPGDLLILATDGIRTDFTEHLNFCREDRPQYIADHILAHSQREWDDALVLVARYKDEPAPHNAPV
jgi:serine/threonine protein phosphatase PrpC